MEYKFLNSLTDLDSLKSSLDYDYNHRHDIYKEHEIEFPCIAIYQFYDDPQGPYSYDYEFIPISEVKEFIDE